MIINAIVGIVGLWFVWSAYSFHSLGKITFEGSTDRDNAKFHSYNLSIGWACLGFVAGALFR